MNSQEEVSQLLSELGINDPDGFKKFIMESRDIENDLTRLKYAEIVKVAACLPSTPVSTLSTSKRT